MLFVFPAILICQTKPAFLSNEHAVWVDSVFSKMSVEQKIGQLLMPRGNYSGQPHDAAKLKEYINKYHVGGYVFFAGPPTPQAVLTNELQAISKIPLMIGQDFEWGLAMRIDSADRYPYNMALGAMEDGNDLIEAMGVEVGRQCKRLGVHVNYAPVVDVNVNPANPVINFRSYGENRDKVAQKGLAYMKGLQSQKIIATAKHFPGHGDTDVDSHHDLPIIPHGKARLDSIEFYPFATLINGGLAGIMTSHLEVPVLEKRKGIAATFSPSILKDVLRGELGFEGLTFTDAMDMQGAVKSFPKGEAMVEALLAGNDVLETFMDVPLAVESITKAVQSGKIPIALVDEKVKKILMAKAWVGLNNYKPIVIEGLVNDLNTRKSALLNREMAESFVTLVSNENAIVPIKDLTSKIAIVTSGDMGDNAFTQMCANYTNIDVYYFDGKDSTTIQPMVDKLAPYDLIINSLHLNSIRPASSYGINGYTRYLISEVGKKKNTILAIFGNVYSLGLLPDIEGYDAVVMAYQNTYFTQQVTAQAIFGALPFNGKLPVGMGDVFKSGQGIVTNTIQRMSYGLPEQVGLDGPSLEADLDSIMRLGLAEKAFPGGVVQVVKDGRAIFQKAYGFHTYEEAQKGAPVSDPRFESGVKSDAMDYFGGFQTSLTKASSLADIPGSTKINDVFDFASVTKISASALTLMRMQTQGLFDENKTFGTYVPSLKGTNKEDLIFKDLLTHRSGLRAWIPFWRNAVDTVQTIEKAVKLFPELQNVLVLKRQKRNFFDKLFGRKKALITDFDATAENATAWAKLLNPESITWKKSVFSPIKKEGFGVRIHDDMWLADKGKLDVLKQIADSPIKPNQGYVYSDLHFYLYPEMVKAMTGKTFEAYIGEVYKSLGANSLGFLPESRFPLDQIIPTEYDSLFRKFQIHGQVHDEGAAMLGGISGHAGLFGNVNDLSKLLMMYLQYGNFGGKEYIGKGIVEKFTSYQFPEENNRRGLVFDKPSLDKAGSNAPLKAGPSTFGHSGYTGPFVWVDPKENFFYVILCNRVYPTRNNTKVIDMNLRTGLGDVIYKAIEK